MKELHDLETHEVSLVPKGANGKQFLIFKGLKGKNGMKDAKEIVEWMSKNTDEKALAEVSKVIKAIDPSELGEKNPAMLTAKAQSGLQAIARIANAMKDEIHPSHLVKVLHASGYDMQKAMDVFGNPDGDVHNPDGEPPHTLHDSSLPLEKDHMKAIPEEILSDMKDVLKSKLRKAEDGDEDEDYDDDDGMDGRIHKDMMRGTEEAMKAYKAHMEKLGYRKYPDVQPRMKARKDFKQVDIGDIAHDKTEERGMDDVSKSLDLSKVADPKVKTALEAVFKANKEAVQKAERLEKELKEEREARRHKELVEKAEKLGVGAKTEDLVAILKALPAAEAEKFETIMKATGEQVKKADLFKEIGTSAQSYTGGDAYAKLEKMAEGLVQKSEGKWSKEVAMEEILKTAEGKALYNEYLGTKPNMKA